MTLTTFRKLQQRAESCTWNRKSKISVGIIHLVRSPNFPKIWYFLPLIRTFAHRGSDVRFSENFANILNELSVTAQVLCNKKHFRDQHFPYLPLLSNLLIKGSYFGTLTVFLRARSDVISKKDALQFTTLTLIFCCFFWGGGIGSRYIFECCNIYYLLVRIVIPIFSHEFNFRRF